MNTEKVRTTMRPHEELEVSPEEATDLRRQGLLYEEEAPRATSTQDNRTATATGDK